MDLSVFNKAQQEAILKTEGPTMILAGAGSGKTRTLVGKIVHLIEEMNLSPFQVLAVTFSNKAAREMRDRVSQELDMDIRALQITTFHSFCAQVLRSEANYLGLSRNFTIYDDGESKAVIKTLMKRKGISQKELSPFEVRYYIDDLKNNAYYEGRKKEDDFIVDKADLFYTYFQEYESELHRANAIDFGGLITGVLQLFELFPEVLQRYQNRFKYILVDEYQDTNRAQFELIRLLSGDVKNICVVGDEDQSIYSWRGADIRNILDFEKVFPEVEIIKLEQNYRSSKNIIEAASHVIEKNLMRKGKTMWTDNPSGDNIDIVECQSDKTEGLFLVEKIQTLREEGERFQDIAVFYRTNSQSRIIEDYLRKYRLPYRVVGGVKFYERKEIKDLLAYLRLIVNAKDSLALSRIINIPARGVGATSLRKLEAEAIKAQCSLLEIMDDIVEKPENYAHLRLSAKIKSSLSAFSLLINEVKTLESQGVSPATLYEKILHESGYYALLSTSKDYESVARLENLEELGNAIAQFEEGAEKPSIQGFLETITLDTTSDNDDYTKNDGEVSLMTIHGAKGLEFPYVFVVGAEENLFPSYRSLESGENALEEERRLFYVAMTRAMKKLFITFAQGRMLYGDIKFNGPSRFIHEIPNKFFEWKKYRSNEENHYGQFEPEQSDFSQDISYDEPVIYREEKALRSKFVKGTSVLHPLYGEGIVLESVGHGGDEKVLVRFKDGAVKRFMAKFASFQIL